MDPQDLVPVSVETDPIKAEIMKSALENEGVACRVAGGRQAGFAGVLEVVLLVRAQDEERARQVLASHAPRGTE